MANPTPQVSCTYGAPMGRRGSQGEPVSNKYNLIRVRINSGGYGSGGAYWGLGNPLYYYEDENGNSGYMRARNRDHAKEQIRTNVNVNARFYR